MRILVDIGHPGQVHLFRLFIRLLAEKGHDVFVTVKEIPTAVQLLDAYGISYKSLGKKFDSVLLKGLSQLKFNYNLYRYVRKNRIDVALGSSLTITHVSIFHKMKAIVLDDDDAEAVRLFSLFAHPFADCILSPAALAHQRSGSKDVTYNGTHELFYLHPDYFVPDSTVLEEIGISPSEPFFIVRFVSGKAYHDLGEQWMTDRQKMEIIKLLEPHGRVFITTERDIEPVFRKWQLKVKPEKIHHLLFYSTLFVGDSQTMTSEAAILGTPALKCNTFAHKLSIPNMLEDKYDLCYSYLPSEFDVMIRKITDLLDTPGLKTKWKQKRDRFLKESINPTKFLLWFTESYPDSISLMKSSDEFQKRFI